MDFKPVDPRTIPNRGSGRRGRISYPLLKSFMESNEPMVVLDLKGVTQSVQTLRAGLGSYIRSHRLPVDIFQREGELYLARKDMEMDEDGNVTMIEDWDEEDIASRAVAPLLDAAALPSA